MTPYEVFFFSSGGVEEHWDKTDLRIMRANVFVGFRSAACSPSRSPHRPIWSCSPPESRSTRSARSAYPSPSL
jgi:hypothetical protein